MAMLRPPPPGSSGPSDSPATASGSSPAAAAPVIFGAPSANAPAKFAIGGSTKIRSPIGFFDRFFHGM
eukprot:9863370-Alexandrium_andersonii.AAC.1